jgi:hypothetical protein
VNELGLCGQPGQKLFENQPKQGSAKHLVSQGYLQWYVLSAKGNGLWKFSLNYQTVGRQYLDKF